MTGTMKFYRHLYVSESIRNPEKVKWKLRANAGQFSIYIIALAKSDDQLDIFHCALLQQKFYDKEDLFIVGLAASYTEGSRHDGKGGQENRGRGYQKIYSGAQISRS